MLPYFLVFLLVVGRVLAQPGNWTTSPFNPLSMPLAVKSPYMNAWALLGFGTTGSAPTYGAWPRVWDTNQGILGWYASIRVDGKSYNLLGDAGTPAIDDAIQQSFVFSPTRSSYLHKAGPVNVNMTFMTSIEATDITRQSMPFTYLYFNIQSNDGSAHSVQIYSDLSGEWISGDSGLNSNWTINESTNFVYLQMGLTSPGPFQEISNRPQDGTVYYCMKKTGGVSWQIGPADQIRGSFANGTGLNKTAEQGTHPVGNPFDTTGIAVDLGSISSTSEPVAYALGVVRDPVVQYTNRLVQIEQRSAYYWSQFSNIHDVIEDVLDHFDDALSAAISVDSQLLSAAGQISGEYAELLSLSTRQAMGALEYTVLRSNGAFNTSDVKAFMKDMGSIGSGGVNAVDVLYSSMPVYLYLNPAILGYLLSPLLEYQESTQYTNPYAAQDLGAAFPNATGNPNGHDQKIEHTASMLIMSLAHAQASGDGNLLAQHYDLLNRWASYLENNTMSPGDQTTSSSDGIVATNQTNLVLKGIIGIGAMAKISEYAGRSDDQSHYEDVAKQYVQEWTSLASGSGQLVLSFGSGSSGLIYNLYADKLLQLNLFNSSVYDLQTSFYHDQTSLWKYGIPLDSSNTSSVSRSDWMMFAASSVSDISVRNNMISRVHAYASINNQQNLPFPVAYHPDNGTWTAGENSPAQGAMFAPLALNVAIKSVTFNGRGGSSKNVAAIVGAAVGGIAGVAIIGGLLFFLYRRRRRRSEWDSTSQYNRTDRIERVKPTTYPSDSVLEPLSSTMHPGMHDMRSTPYSQQPSASASFTASTGNIAMYPAPVPFHVRNLTESELTGAGEGSSVAGSGRGPSALGSSTSTGNTQSGPATVSSPRSRAKSTQHQEELRSEVDNLRREIERMKEERVVLADAPPPSYDDEIANALRGPTSK